MAKQQQRDLKLESYWRGVMEQLKRTCVFCTRERLSEPSFYASRHVIRRRDAVSAASSAARTPAFVLVVVAPSASVHADAAGLRGRAIAAAHPISGVRV